MRIHTINRATGKSRIWHLALAFFSYYLVNTFDDEGARALHSVPNRHLASFDLAAHI